MSFSEKYRVRLIEDFLGNNKTKEILLSFFSKKNHPHSFLFYGERGTGKTSIARVLAKKFNCELIEINNSNNRGIDTIRDLIYEGSKYSSFEPGKNKAFLLDEVHQLPALSQDALLKILEEPPNFIYFFLCTTDPQKLKKTIRSRCQQFEMENVSNRLLCQHLIDISNFEKNQISKNVARKIAESSEGHVRDALKMLENVIQLTDEKKQLEIASQKISEKKEVIDLCRNLLNGNWEDCRKILKDLQNENPENIRKIILFYMQKVLLNNSNPHAAIIIDELSLPIYDFPILCLNIFKIFS